MRQQQYLWAHRRFKTRPPGEAKLYRNGASAEDGIPDARGVWLYSPQFMTEAPLCPIPLPRPPLTGLILSGGGARAAYQVGVLAAIADLLPDSAGNPFPVIVGTSAGAINAVGLACGALQFRQAIQRLTAVWQGFRTEHVYRATGRA